MHNTFDISGKIFLSLIFISIFTLNLPLTNGESCSQPCQTVLANVRKDEVAKHSQASGELAEFLSRIIHLENHQNDGDFLVNKIFTLEQDMKGNMTELHKSMTDNYNYLYDEIRKVENKIPALHQTSGAVSTRLISNKNPTALRQTTGTQAQDQGLKNLENKLTALINGEQKNLKNLTDDNATWRANFRKVNATFTTLKRKKII